MVVSPVPESSATFLYPLLEWNSIYDSALFVWCAAVIVRGLFFLRVSFLPANIYPLTKPSVLPIKEFSRALWCDIDEFVAIASPLNIAFLSASEDILILYLNTPFSSLW